jgi:drug/metabolite transporter (DMT)-like permease
VPVIALLSSMLVFHERLAANEWAGIALIGVGLALIIGHALVGGRGADPLPATPTPLDGG